MDDPPPHPLSRLSPAPHAASSNSICKLRRFFHPKQHKTAASAAPGNSGRELWSSAAVVADVLTVSVVVAAPPEGVTVCGLKLHVAPEGSPEQLNETVELKPLSGVIVIVVVALSPAATVSDEGEAAMEKSGKRLMMYVALAMALVEWPAAVAIAWIVSVNRPPGDPMVKGPLYTVELVVGAEPSVV